MSWAQILPIFEAVENLIVSAAVIVGGVWALLMFRMLRQRERARLELDAIQKTLLERAVVRFNITTKQEWIPGLSGFFISVVVEAINNGNRMTVLSYRDAAPVSATRIIVNIDGSLTFGKRFTAVLADPDTQSPAIASSLFPGECEHLSFIVRVNEPGLYLLAFAAKLDESESREVLEGQPHYATVKWRPTAYLVVQPGPLETVDSTANNKLQPSQKSSAAEL
jgi:hypothetical protein